MKIIVITEPDSIDNEAQLIELLLNSGIDRVHIRKPNWSCDELRELISNIDTNLRDRLTLHDHFELAAELNIGGVQLNSRNGVAPDGFHGTISRSCHSLSELAEIGEESYVTLSPIYDSISKGGYRSNFTTEEFKQSNLIGENVIALGGVTPDNIPNLRSLGFGGVALLGYIWQDHNPERIAARAKYAHKMADMSKNFFLQYITHRNERCDDYEGALDALRGGCRWVQLRMKGASDSEFIAEAVKIAKACREYGATFLINDRVELVEQCSADGVHIGKSDMRPSEARKILGDTAIIGGTANTTEDIDRLVAEGVDYIGLGPFRFTSTKEKLSPILGLEGYRRIKQHCAEQGYSIPIVAIGGITTADIPDIIKCGVDGIAASSMILSADDRVATTVEIVNTIKSNI